MKLCDSFYSVTQSCFYLTRWRVSVMAWWPLASERSVEQRKIKYEGQPYNSEIAEKKAISNMCHVIQQKWKSETITTTQMFKGYKLQKEISFTDAKEGLHTAWNVRLAFHAGVIYLTVGFILTRALENHLERVCCLNASLWIFPSHTHEADASLRELMVRPASTIH